MIVLSFKRAFSAMSVVVAGFATLASAPALANSSAASADVIAPVREAQDASISGGDDQFRQLFAQWESLDSKDSAAPVKTTSVSVPSRMPLGSAKLTSGYGMRTHPVLGGRRGHKGIDLAAPTGTPIYATADGVVSKAERFSSYGLYIAIEHGAKLQTRFAHMSRLAVASGQEVEKGDIIGYVGSTGRSTGPHLHYEVRVDGRAVNPMPYMAESEAQQAYALAIGEGGRGGN